ncbi:hypothetical protein RJP21_03880 [Paenibacillus sp. VCA1]|uniref:hypothetical protein n=1 Tax=Paenibacillus sp. VCA1 TaxID=3039148 RepID=UPI002871D86D|nr:hypothetical protein [Paenibacillus sp. VCA1]MDR9852743.1 hypothetical protein [Paenibacillus sp. VCA1]
MGNSFKKVIAFITAAMVLLAGCDGVKSKDAAAVASGEGFSPILISEKDDFFSQDTIRDLEKYLEQGVTIREGLKNSGIVTFADDGSIHSISQVSLSPAFTWGIELNDKKLGKDKLDTVLKENDELGISIEPTDPKTKEVQYSVLKINGGTIMPSISHTYILPYAENENVRDMLTSTDFIELTLNKRMVHSIKGYVSKAVEKWVIKVNGKELTEDGFDMRLSPLDEVEIKLDRA